MATNFMPTVPQPQLKQPVIIRPKPVYAPSIFTPEQEAFLRSIGGKP
jgi:hypothetical protein